MNGVAADGMSGEGWAVVGAEDPLLYIVKWVAIIVMLAAVLVIICEEPKREA